MSWTIFYYEMQNHMLKQQIGKASPVPSGKGIVGKAVSFAKGKVADSIVDAQAFAEAFCDAYDKTVKTGKTMVGGVPVGSGNKKIMQAVLISEMLISKSTGKGMFNTLLEQCGNAVIAYWTGAEIAKFPVPNIPCFFPPAVQNITTLKAYNLSPGYWTNITIGPQVAFEPFLLSFIASAMLHCLTLGGFFQCQCALTPPAPPAPSILPWVGYYVAPPVPAGGLLKKALLKTIAARKRDAKSIYNLAKDKIVANQKLILGIAAGTIGVGLTGLGVIGLLNQNQQPVPMPAYFGTPAGQNELAKLQKEGISQQLADEIATTISNTAPVYEDIPTNYDNSGLTDSPKTISEQIKSGDIQTKVNNIKNITNKDVLSNNNLQKSIAQTFKTPTSGDLGKIVPKSITAPIALIAKESYGIAYNKIQNSALTNIQKINLLDISTKNLANGRPTENIDTLIKEKENDKTKG